MTGSYRSGIIGLVVLVVVGGLWPGRPDLRLASSEGGNTPPVRL